VAFGAETFPLADGTALTGDIVSFSDTGIIFRLADDKYSDRVAWTKFSQAGLKQLAANPKIKPLVDPFIEIPPSERTPKPAVEVHEVTRLALPANQSLFGALASSSAGLVALFLIYAANVYSGFEIAVFRNRPKGLVMGVSAVLPVLGPVIFLSLPTHIEAAPVEEQVEAEPVTFVVPGQEPAQEDIHIAAGSWQQPAAQNTGQIFKRGQFTFNRRFIETKFAGFFTEPRSGTEADLVLVLKTTTGEFQIERITRIEAGDMNVEVVVEGGRQEFQVPFADIQELQLQPKAA
jgi:hypothetical protein